MKSYVEIENDIKQILDEHEKSDSTIQESGIRHNVIINEYLRMVSLVSYIRELQFDAQISGYKESSQDY